MPFRIETYCTISKSSIKIAPYQDKVKKRKGTKCASNNYQLIKWNLLGAVLVIKSCHFRRRNLRCFLVCLECRSLSLGDYDLSKESTASCIGWETCYNNVFLPESTCFSICSGWWRYSRAEVHHANLWNKQILLVMALDGNRETNEEIS